jgi:hypothetical protein
MSGFGNGSGSGQAKMDAAGVYEFVGIGELAETTTHLLSLNLHAAKQAGPGRPLGPEGSRHSAATLNRVEALVLQQALDYLHRAREGFVLSVRANQVAQVGELRFLLERVLADWSSLSRELGLEDGPGDETHETRPGDDWSHDPAHGSGLDAEQQVEHVRRQLLAFGMAAIALGSLPRLPSKQITFPHAYSDPPTYADIPAPSTPGEMLFRIEEMEQTVWRMMVDDLQMLVQRRYGPVRRTYGFFEASAWITRREVERFGVKKQRPRIDLL